MGTGTQKKDQKNIGELEGSGVSSSSDSAGSSESEPVKDAAFKERESAGLFSDKIVDEFHKGNKDGDASPSGKESVVGTSSQTVENKTVDTLLKHGAISQQGEADKLENAKRDDSIMSNPAMVEKTSLKLKSEMEAKSRKQDIERLADKSFLRGDKLFYYPQVIKPDQDIEVFLDRSLSTLYNEPDILIMGAFNNWRWKNFSTRLKKTNLQGDWWSCQVHVPKEAYKMDFVFFNGQSVYDNNESKDFCIPIEGGMDAFAFEDFLLEEKRRELEKLAQEQAERERQEEERRRVEAERAAIEADRAQARQAVENKRKILQDVMIKAAKSAENVWFIEPTDFNSGDEVKLYYNKSSGPLVRAKEVWVHGGHNNWMDGLTIVERLVRTERKDADWWYAKGI